MQGPDEVRRRHDAPDPALPAAQHLEPAMPAVSVIIPFLNMRAHLPAAVDSARAQAAAEWELILVDDGSGDGGAEWAAELARSDPDRIRFLAPAPGEARGASAARNRGLRAARGEYIAFLDADDVWLPGKTERQLGILRANPAAAMTFARVRYFHDPASDGPEWDQPYRPLREGSYEPPGLTLAFLADDNIYPCPSATLIRRSALREVGGFEERFSKVRTDLAGSSVAAVFGDPDAKRKTDLAFLEWLLEWIDGLPAHRRPELRRAAAEKMFRLLLPDILKSPPKSAWQWRRDMLKRMWRYPAFRTELCWLRRLVPGVRD
jgi:glycosyltransferase involved in cell wall biosynthesis